MYCPTCGASPGENCEEESGAPRLANHAERVERYGRGITQRM